MAMKVTPAVRAVWRELDRQAGTKLSAQRVARETRLPVGTCRSVLTRMHGAGWVQVMTQTGIPDRPAHPVYWLTPAGRTASV